MVSSITRMVPLAGDAELARQLASGASAGWRGLGNLVSVAKLCQWPDTLRDDLLNLAEHELSGLSTTAHELLRCFGDPEHRVRYFRAVLDDGTLTLDDSCTVGVQVTSTAQALRTTAVLGLIRVIEEHGHEVLQICISSTCTQPVLRKASHLRSTACSPECANRARVARHRASRRTLHS